MKKLFYCVCFSFVLSAAVWALPVTDGLIIHLKADSLSLADGAQVTEWADSAVSDTVDGTIRVVTGATAPTFKVAGYNGRPVVHFNAASKQALMSGNWAWPNASAGVSLFIVCQAGPSRTVHIGDVAGAGGKSFNTDMTWGNATAFGSGVRWNNGYTVVNNTLNPNPLLFEGQWHASVRQMAQAGRYDSLIYAVDSLPALTMSSNYPARLLTFDAASNIISVGNCRLSGTWSGSFYNGDVAEVVVYNKQLTSQEIEQTLGFLNNQYLILSAHNPAPAVGSSNVDLQTTFSWSTGLDPNNFVDPNPNITDHYFYLTADEPNFLHVSPVTIPAGDPVQAAASYGPITLNLDKTYYWRIDESVNGSAANDGNTITGPVWTFESRKSIPVITTQPTNQKVFPGETAAFSVTVSSISAPSYSWYKSADESSSTPADDLVVGTNSSSYSGTFDVSDEGFYFCKVTNGGGSVYSNVASLGVKREVAHWTLDGINAEGQYVDISPAGHNAEPNLPPVEGSFMAGVDPSETANALDMTVRPLTAAQAGSWAPANMTGEFTISAWINWAGSTSLWQGIVSNRLTTAETNFYVGIRNNNGNVELGGAGITALQGSNLPLGSWAHLAVTASSEKYVIYINGIAVATRTPGTVINDAVFPMFIGCLNRDATGAMTSLLNGGLDDVRVFNYAKNNYAVADLYDQILETPVCLNPGSVDLSFDHNNDCRISLADFSEFAATWLNCGFYPQTYCQ